jgi:hypothetical protein
MAGVLSFTLGLETSNFLRGIGMASSQILSLAGFAQGLQAAMNATWAAVERGGVLNDLSARTGESVKNLYQLQEAFKVVGVSADNVPTMILKMQKALSGVSDGGEKTSKAFGALGLNMDDLKGLDAPAQFAAIGQALAGLNKESAAGIASILFGREGAGNMLQLARDAQGFNEALADSLQEAVAFERIAAAADKVGDVLGRIKGKVAGLFAGVAEGILPILQQAFDYLNSFDWVGIGRKIGDSFRTIAAIWQDGRLDELISLTFQAAMEKATAIFTAAMGGMMEIAFATIGSAQLWQGIAEAALSGLVGLGTGLLDVIAGPLADLFGDREGFDARQAERKEYSRQQAADAAKNAVSGGMDLAKKIGESLHTAFAAAGAGGPAEANLRAFLASYPGGSSAAAVAGAASAGADVTLPGNGAKLDRPDVTAWEKIGASFGSGANEPARQTAAHTRQLVQEVKRTNLLLAKTATGTVLND